MCLCSFVSWKYFCRPSRFILLLFLFSCFFHICQIYLEYRRSVQKVRETEHFLFLSQERRYLKKKSQNAFEKIDQPFRNQTKVCKIKKSILFVKTHKTGSTTLTNIVLRFALKHRLVVGLPLPRHWQLGGYPAKFDPKIVLPRLPQYDVFCHHLRYDHNEVRKLLPLHTIATTVLRDPAEGFESGFSFFRDWPYPRWFENVSAPGNLQRFLNQPLNYYNSSTPWYFRAKNYMAFDLGFNHERNEFKYAQDSIKKMEKWFDLVMITERLDESLILLKELLCIKSYEEISYLRLKVRQGFARHQVTEAMKLQVKSWNLLDSKLYKYFNKTLSRKVHEYGKNKMEKALKEFRDVQEKVNDKCVDHYDQYDRKPWISRIKLKPNSGELCEMMSWGEVRFGDYVREMQRSYDKSEDVRQPTLNQLQLLFENAQASIIGLEAARKSA